MLPMINSFAPIEPPHCRLLLLGSIPGKASLAAKRYYAHPRNAFWPIMTALLQLPADANYDQRIQALQQASIGLWDVMQACVRASSLDSDIQEDSIQPNDFAGWFQRHPETRAVFCNGGKALQSYQRYVLPLLDTPFCQLPVYQLPSTSPAHARLNQAQKLALWQQAITPFMGKP